MFSLAELFRALDKTRIGSGDKDNTFVAHPVPGFTRHRIACNCKGAPALLVQAVPQRSTASGQVVELENLTVIPSADCVITTPSGNTETGTFVIVQCTSSDSLLREYFLQMLEGILGIIGPTPSGLEVAGAIANLVSLFRAMATPARQTVQGLWAELLLIAAASDPVALMKAWHTTPLDRYDFNEGVQRLEVKSSSSRIRQHSFSLAQLQPPENTNLFVVSIIAEQSGGGTSINELATEIRAGLSGHPELIARLDSTIVSTLGETWKRAFYDRFDRELALDSIAFYDYKAVPSITADIPARVSDIRFKADLTGLSELSRMELREQGGLSRAGIPRRIPG